MATAGKPGAGFTCAGSWKCHRRASCTMQNLAIVHRAHFYGNARIPKAAPARQHRGSPGPWAGNSAAPERSRRSKTKEPTVPPTFHFHPAARLASTLTTAVVLTFLAAPQDSFAGKPKHPNAGTAQKAKGKGPAKVTYRPSPSEESRAERERRLFRECRGLPDAGACRGFTRR